MLIHSNYMARARGKSKSPRRRSKVISLLNVGEGIAQANIVTQAFLGTSAIGFVLDDPSEPGISIRDAIQSPQKLSDKLGQTLNVENIAMTAFQSALLNVGFRFGRRALRGSVNKFNRSIMSPLALGFKL